MDATEEWRLQSPEAPGTDVVDRLTTQQYLDDVASTMCSALPRMLPAMTVIAERLRARCGSTGAALLAGNGGASALLTHFASEVMSPSLGRDFVPLRCIDLTGNSPLFSAATNDLGAPDGIASIVRAVASIHDSLVVVSTSGASNNLVRAAEMARDCGTPVISFIGRSGSPLEMASDVSWVAGTPHAEVAQDMFSIALHLLSLLLKRDQT